MVAFSALPVPVNPIPFCYDLLEVRSCPGGFLRAFQSFRQSLPFQPFVAFRRGFVFLVLILQLGGIVSGMFVLLQFAFQLQSAFLCQSFLLALVLRRTIREIRPIGKAILGQIKGSFFYLLLGIFFLIGKITIKQQLILP